MFILEDLCILIYIFPNSNLYTGSTQSDLNPLCENE